MKESMSKYLRPKTAFFVLAVFLVGFNFASVIKSYRSALVKNGTDKHPEPGFEFAGFKEKLSGLKRVGFLTNKDMSPERNDGQFLGAQYMLAPVVLDLGNPRYRWVILDCTSLIPAFDMMQEIKAAPIDVNEHSKVLAERKP